MGEPELRPDADIGSTLAAIARAMLARITIEDGQPDVTLIHNLRRALKRWRAFLRLLEPMLGVEATVLRHAARDLARSLAGARDAQAALDALADFGEDYSLPKTVHAAIKARIDKLRTAAETETLTPEAREQVRILAQHIGDSVDHWQLDAVRFRDVAASLTEGYGRARKAMPPDWTAATAEDLHGFRQRVVVHRYQMEIAEPLWPRLGRVWVGETQRLRERLGHHQDLAVLAALTGPRQPLARWCARLDPIIAARQKEHIEAAMRQAGRLFAERPRDFERRLQALWDAGVS